MRVKLNEDEPVEPIGKSEEISETPIPPQKEEVFYDYYLCTKLSQVPKTNPLKEEETPQESENSLNRPKRRNSLDGFIEHDVNDAKTMKRSGTLLQSFSDVNY